MSTEPVPRWLIDAANWYQANARPTWNPGGLVAAAWLAGIEHGRQPAAPAADPGDEGLQR